MTPTPAAIATNLCSSVMLWINKKEKIRKKRACNKAIIQVDNGTFTLLVFSIKDSMGSKGRESQRFYSRLAELISEKREHQQSISSN